MLAKQFSEHVDAMHHVMLLRACFTSRPALALVGAAFTSNATNTASAGAQRWLRDRHRCDGSN
jgi:hypothetical protein